MVAGIGDEDLIANDGKLEEKVYRLPEYLDAEVARIPSLRP